MNVTAKHVSEALSDTSVLESENTKGQETESNAAVEALGTSEEVKEQVRLLAAENKRLIENKESLEKTAEQLSDRNEALTNLKETLSASNKDASAKIEQLEIMNEQKLNEIHYYREEVERLKHSNENKTAEINALTSNNESLHKTNKRISEELDHIKRELRLATEEVDAVRMTKPQLAEKIMPANPVIVTEEKWSFVMNENEALKTSLKAIVGAYL